MKAFVAGAAEEHYVEPSVWCVAVVMSFNKAGLIAF